MSRPPMDVMLLRTFQRQVWVQTLFFLFAWKDHENSLARGTSDDQAYAWYCVENMLNSAANISKALWGSRGREADTRRELRNSLGILDSSALNLPPRVRDHFEHIDERIDQWWEKSARHNYVDMNIGRPLPGFDQIDMFRNYDPASHEVWFWGEIVDLAAIHAEILGFYDVLQAEVRKPHW